MCSCDITESGEVPSREGDIFIWKNSRAKYSSGQAEPSITLTLVKPLKMHYIFVQTALLGIQVGNAYSEQRRLNKYVVHFEGFLLPVLICYIDGSARPLEYFAREFFYMKMSPSLDGTSPESVISQEHTDRSIKI